MRAKINITINLPDEFKLGSCKGCPYHSISEYESSYQSYTRTEKCLLKFDKVTCPIEPINSAETSPAIKVINTVNSGELPPIPRVEETRDDQFGLSKIN